MSLQKIKLKDGITRYYFKEAMKDILPNSIYNRKTKANISPFAYNQIKDSFYKEMDIILDSKSKINEFVDIQELIKFYKKKGASKKSFFISLIY